MIIFIRRVRHCPSGLNQAGEKHARAYYEARKKKNSALGAVIQRISPLFSWTLWAVLMAMHLKELGNLIRGAHSPDGHPGNSLSGLHSQKANIWPSQMECFWSQRKARRQKSLYTGYACHPREPESRDVPDISAISPCFQSLCYWQRIYLIP